MMRQTVCLLLAAACCGCMTTGNDSSNGHGGYALEERIWQLHDYDMAHIEHVIGLAPTYGANRIQLSHGIVMFAEEVLEHESRVQHFDLICEAAHANGLAVDMWTHELNGVPDEYRPEGVVDFDNPGLWAWLTDKYERLFAVAPDLDGLVLTFHETAVSVYDDSRTRSALPKPQRVAKLIDAVAEVCNARGKRLYVRTFAYRPHELHVIRDGIIAAKSDFTVMSKEVPHDWQPYYPPNPLLGDVGGRRQVVEMDPGAEYYGQSRVLYCAPEYMKMRLCYAIEKGVVGAVARIERYNNHILDTPNEVNLYTLKRLWEDPSADTEEIWLTWARAEYGEKGAPYAVSALARTDDIINIVFFPVGFWLSGHSRLPGLGEIDHLMATHSTTKWLTEPDWVEMEKRINNPDPDLLKRVWDDYERAIAMCEESLADIARAKPLISKAKHGELLYYLSYVKDVAGIWQSHFDCYFRYKMLEQAVAGKSAEGVPDLETLRLWLAQGMARHGQRADEMERTYGAEIWPGRPGRARGFLEEIRKRVEQLDETQ